MQRAFETARDTFRFFWRELSWEHRRIVPAFDIACVKVAFSEGQLVEHMWLDSVRFDGQTVHGVLMNEPHDLKRVHEGDEVSALLSERVNDWILASEAGVLGAHTVQLMRSRMGLKERRAQDEAWGFDFGDPTVVTLPPTGDDHPMAINMAGSLTALLKKEPGAVHRIDEHGWTPLHNDALAGNANIVAILLAHGADRNALTPAGKTARALAAGWPRVEALLADLAR